MIGLDTNILVRFFMQDDAAQCARVDHVMRSLSATEPGWVSMAVIMELVWVLTSTYRFKRLQTLKVLVRLLSLEEIVIEQTDVVRQAVQIYSNANLGFADCLISSSALAAECTLTFTFDEDAAKSAGMTLVP